jgi:hypothetical protein
MCDPVTAALIASTVISTGTGILQSNQIAKANERVAAANLAAQNNFNRELDRNRETARGEFANSLERSTRDSYEDDLAAAIEKRRQRSEPIYENRVFMPGQNNADPTSAVNTAITTKQNQGEAENRQLDTLLATLEGFGDASFERDLGLRQNSNRIATAADYTRGALDTLAAEQNAANYAGDKNLAKADKIGAIGNLASSLVSLSGGMFGKDPTAITAGKGELAAGKNTLINSGGNAAYGLY